MTGKKILKNVSWLIFDKIFMLLLGLIVVVKVANHYGPSEYGFYQYALSINILLGVIALFVDGRVVKKHYKGKNEGYIIYNTTIAKLALSIVSLIIGILILLVIGRGIKFNTIYLLLLMNNIVINLAFGIQNYFEYRLKSKNVVIASNIANIISAALQLTAIFLDFSIISIVTIILIASFIKLLILFYQFEKSFSIKILTTANRSLISGIIRESAPLAIAAIAAIVYNRIDQVMLGAMLGVNEVGIYSISSQMITVVAIAISPIQISVYPKMIEWYNSNIDIYYKKYQAITSLTTWIYIAGTAFAFIVAPVLFDKFLGAAYSKSLDVFRVQVFGALFMYNAALRSSHFTLTGNTNIMMVSQIIAVFVNIVLNYLMIPEIGIYGAAAATVITQFFSLFLSNLFFKNGRKIFWLQLKGLNPMYIVQGLRLKESHQL